MRWDARKSQQYEEAFALADSIHPHYLDPYRKDRFKRPCMMLNLLADH